MSSKSFKSFWNEAINPPHRLILQPSRSRFWSLRLWLRISHPPRFSVDIWSRSASLSPQPDLHSNPRSVHCRQKGQRSFSALHMELPKGQKQKKEKTTFSTRGLKYNAKSSFKEEAFTQGWQVIMNTRGLWSWTKHTLEKKLVAWYYSGCRSRDKIHREVVHLAVTLYV